jgi:glycosyltransferase involved in cell wall biosynthesis
VFQAFQIDPLPKGVRLLGRVGDSVLPALYAGAAGFVYGSIYEGFGLPPLEALACGCPVAISDIPAHREVCGNYAQYFNPFDSADLSTKLERLLRLDQAQRAEVAEQGVGRAALYSWETAAAQTWQILQQEANR